MAKVLYLDGNMRMLSRCSLACRKSNREFATRLTLLLCFVVAALVLHASSPLSAQSPKASAPYQAKMVAPEDAKADIALLRRGLETIHPGLYRYTSKAEIDAAFAKLESAASTPISELALHRKISLMLATIHCDHTKAEMSDALETYRNANPTHLAFRFKLIEGRMIVYSNDGQPGAPSAGSEVTAINGMAVPGLLTRLGKAVAYDGDTDQSITTKLEHDSDLMGDDFNEYYPSFFGFPESWRIEWKPIGARDARSANLTPIRFNRWVQLNAPDGEYQNEFYKSVTWHMAGKAARLKIDTFVNYRNPVQPTAFLGGFFKAMKDAGTEHLILDLRNNGGGSDDVPIALGRYLSNAPFVFSKPVRLKAIRYGDLLDQIESWGDRDSLFNPPVNNFTQTADGWFEKKPDPNASELDDDVSTIEHLPAKADRFSGKLTVLTGSRNGSGATLAIAQLKERGGASLVGEDTSGSGQGPTAGQIFLLTLPKSGLKVRIPVAWNRTNISHFVPRMGVPADVFVLPTLADYQAGRDRVLEVARQAPAPISDPAAALAGALAGHWTGTLDYRDYGDDHREVLPTILDAKGLTLSWTYDDGPGKTVRLTELWEVDPVAQSVTMKEGKNVSVGKIVELHEADDKSNLTLVLDGTASENDKKVVTRTILTRSAGTLRMTSMSQQAGEPFLMRHSYELKQEDEGFTIR